MFLELVSLNTVVELRGRLVLGFGLNAVFSALRRVLTVLIICLHRLVHARVMSRALIVSMSSCMSNSHRIPRHIIHKVQLIARSLHGVHVARCVQNSSNSLGDGVVRGRGVCVPGETKSLSTSTRSGVRRSAVHESAHTQQTPLKMHVETWAGLQRNQGPKIFREVEIVQGCASSVACPLCPDHSPEPPGPGRKIRNMLGWTLEERTDRCGVWLFRGALQGENIFLPFPQLETGRRRGRTTQRERSPAIPHALVRMRTGEAPLSGHVLESGVGHC